MSEAVYDSVLGRHGPKCSCHLCKRYHAGDDITKEPSQQEQVREWIEKTKREIPPGPNPYYTPDSLVSKPDKNEMVDHPAHYNRSPVEIIDIIRDLIITTYGRDGFKAYCWGNEIKYRMRAGLKGDPVTDIEKAMKYMEFREEAE